MSKYNGRTNWICSSGNRLVLSPPKYCVDIKLKRTIGLTLNHRVDIDLIRSGEEAFGAESS